MAQLAPNAKFDPVRLADTRLLLQANSGGGKSWALRLICEQCLKQLPVIVLDWEDEFHTLREKFDVVLAREDGDVPVEIRSAGLLARKLIDLNLSAVINLNSLDLTLRRRYVKLFLEELLRAAKRKPASRLVVLDEGQDACPQSQKAESTDAVVALASQGRKRGLGMVIATQRISRLNNDAAFECRNNLIGLTNFSADQKRVAELMGLTTADERRQLAGLQEGEFFAWGPAFAGQGIVRIKTDRVATTHLDARTRQSAIPPAPSKRITGVLGEFADLAKQAEAEVADMNQAKAEITRLRRELTVAQKSGGKPVEKVVTDEKAIARAVADRDREWHAKLTELQKSHKSLLRKIETGRATLVKVVETLNPNGSAEVAMPLPALTPVSTPRPVNSPRPTRTAARDTTAVETDGINLSKAERLILRAFYWLREEQADPAKVSFFAGYSVTSGGFKNACGSLRSSGLVAGWAITDAGINLAEAFVDEDKPHGPELREWLRPRLSKAENEVLDAVIGLWETTGERGTHDQVAQATASNYSPTSGGFKNAMGRLRTLEAIEGYERDGGVRPHESLL